MTDVPTPITPENTALVFIDLAEGPLRSVGSSDPTELRANAGALAEAAALLRLPTIIAEARIPEPAGRILPEVTSHLPSAVRVPHATNNSWHTPAFVDAVRATGRTHLVMAGIATDVGLALTALSGRAAGFVVFAVVDASGTLTRGAEEAAWIRMSQAGVALVSWASVIGEVQGDYTTNRGQELRAVIGRRLGASSAGPFANHHPTPERRVPTMSETKPLDRPAAEALVAGIHDCDHRFDLEGFLALLDPEVSLRLGSGPPLVGRDSVRGAIAGLFSQLAGIQHRLIALTSESDTVLFEAEVTYTVRDGRTVTVPYADALRIGPNGLVRDYRIYIDLAPLYALLAP